MDWTFYVAVVVLVLAVISVVVWHPDNKDDLDDAIRRYVKWRRSK